MSLNAALADLGVVLRREPLVERQLATGELRKLFDQPRDDGRHYDPSTRKEGEMPDGARRLAEWLVRTRKP